MPQLNINDIRKRLLVSEAKKWLSITEKGGDNCGEIIEMFQRTVDGKATKEPWCMDFVQYCLGQVDNMVDEIMQRSIESKFRNQIASYEHCLTVWKQTSSECVLNGPQMGSISIWQHGDSNNGHTGIVAAVNKAKGFMWTIEGNTGPQDKEIVREGDGVYLKKRNIIKNGSMKVLGFLNPWPLSFSVDLH